MTFHHYIRALTEVIYPDGPFYHKWDYFSISDEELPERFRAHAEKAGSDTENYMKFLHPLSDDFYTWLNDGGYWVKGWHEINERQQNWLDENPDMAGSQTETVLETEFI
jgi:hypothetical protein